MQRAPELLQDEPFLDRCLGGKMQDQAGEVTATPNGQPGAAGGVGASKGRFSLTRSWPVLAGLTFGLVAGAISVRSSGGPRFDWLLMLAAAIAGIAVALLSIRLLLIGSAGTAGSTALAAGMLTGAEPDSIPDSILDSIQGSIPISPEDLLDSAGPAVVGIRADGSLNYVNPSAERLLGYHARELKKAWSTVEILAPGEGARLVMEMERLCGVQRSNEPTPQGRMAAYMSCARSLPPSQVPSFDAQLRRKDGTLLPVLLHISALRDSAGACTGLVAVALDQSATVRHEQARRESHERFRDLFDNSTEMIATLSPAGKFLYANPAWKQCFGKDAAALLELTSFENLFAPGERGEVGSLFRLVLDGETVDRAPLRHHTPDGRLLDLELSLSQRQEAGSPLAVRCLVRDVTEQKQREHRLALQLQVSQIVGENASSEQASMRILEALCVSQGWDMAVKWAVDAEGSRLEFSSAWGAPGKRAEAFIHESMGLRLASGTELPVRAWKDGRAVWVADLASMPYSPRIESALRHEMISGWAVPVRVGNKVLAILEFYCHFCLREDGEALAAIETVAGSLGQLLARSHEYGRAEDLYRQQEILLDSVADGICGVDRHGMVSFANPAAARLLGAPAVNLTGKSVHELLHGSAPANLACTEDCQLRRAGENHKAATGEDTIYRAGGTSFPAEYALTPILDQGRFSGSVLSFRDISQRYALDRLKDEFISTVSHELRTPLTSIRGALGLLSSGILGEMNDKAANLLRIASTNSDRLVRLINDILDLERIQSGREPLAFRPVKLAEIVHTAIDGMAPVAEAAGVQLIHDTTKVEIAADPDRLLQVLTNLLSNAVKFSPPSSTISVMLRPGTSGVTLSVIDQGRGIPEDKLEAVFGRFQQVDAADSRQKGGSGLGLAICRTIVMQHSGRIWAERNPVRGTTFRVFLPYMPAPVEAAGASGDEPAVDTLLADADAPSRHPVSANSPASPPVA
jgi:PAS domain S-box-containing protein